MDLTARYNEALKRYLDRPPQDRPRGYDPVSAELDHLECAMLDNPPAGQRRGLVLPGEMERPANVPPLASLTLEEANIQVLSDDEILDVIANQDRTPPDAYPQWVLDQGQVGSCAAEAACGAMACRRNEDGEETPELNPYGIYCYSSGGSDRGSTLDANLALLQEIGAPSAAVRPRSKGWRAKPTDEEAQDALNYRLPKDGVVKVNNKREFITMSLAGFPIQFGYTGHSIWASDIIDLERFTYMNSWNKSWGNNGRGTIAYSRIYWGYGAYAVIAARGKE